VNLRQGIQSFIAMNEFNYIIVGAGSAGCVLANKLGSDPNVSVLVIEAGPMDRDLMIHIPAGVSKVWRHPKFNWSYTTSNESHLDQRTVDIPRGKVVGGSSSINSMVYMRGHPQDYDSWANKCGLANWRYADCLPYFKAGESSDRGASEWRGDAGELHVTKGFYDNPLYDAFLDAGKQAGQGYSEDLNAYQPEGVARYDATKGNGRRCSAAVAHLKPALKRGNVRLLNNALVHKVLFDGTRAAGVQVEHRGEVQNIQCNGEVVLSGGAINSPQLLMLSGVGPKAQLGSVGVEPVVELEGVGQHLQDHASIILQYECSQRFPIHRINSSLVKAAAGAYWIFTRKGMAASNIWEAGGLVRSNDSVQYPNIQYHFGPIGIADTGTNIHVQQGFAIHIDLLRPQSRGAIGLKSTSAKDKPDLTFNFLSTRDDLRQLVEGVDKLRDLISQPAFDAYRGREIAPGPEYKSADDVARWIKQACETDFHPCGTCRMGHSDDCVVNDQFQVYGCDNLRVVDASVMPRILSGNLNAPTQMIAARAADSIMGRPQRAPEFARFHFNN